MGAIGFIWTFEVSSMFLDPSAALCHEIILSRRFTDSFSDTVCALTLSPVEPYIGQCVPFQIICTQLTLPYTVCTYEFWRTVFFFFLIAKIIHQKVFSHCHYCGLCVDTPPPKIYSGQPQLLKDCFVCFLPLFFCGRGRLRQTNHVFVV